MSIKNLTEDEREIYTEIAKRLIGPTHNTSALIALRIAMTPDQGKVYLRMPGEIEDIAKETSFSKKFVKDTIHELYHKGYVVQTRKSGYQPARSIIQVFDTGPTAKYAKEMGDEYFFSLYGGMANFAPLVMTSMPIPLLKVIPYLKALEMSCIPKEQILHEENINAQMKKASSIAAHNCSCRRAHWGAIEGENVKVCMCFDFMAEYEVKRGTGKMMSYDQAIEFQDKLAKNWNAITPQNGTYLDAFCNCNYEAECVWDEMDKVNLTMKDGVAPSRYQAIVNPDKCVSCQECVVKCKAQACSMIQYKERNKYKAWVNPDLCMGCGCCVINCKGKACTMITVRPPEFIETEKRPQAGRYDQPEKYYDIVSASAVQREARQKKWAEMEENYCFENNVNRDPYRPLKSIK